MRYKITVEYEGTNLLGWQWQPDGNSAQGFLETAIKRAFGRFIPENIENGALVFPISIFDHTFYRDYVCVHSIRFTYKKLLKY